MKNPCTTVLVRLYQNELDALKHHAQANGFDSVSHLMRYSFKVIANRKNIDHKSFKASKRLNANNPINKRGLNG